jgi:hypothetical protein
MSEGRPAAGRTDWKARLEEPPFTVEWSQWSKASSAELMPQRTPRPQSLGGRPQFNPPFPASHTRCRGQRSPTGADDNPVLFEGVGAPPGASRSRAACPMPVSLFAGHRLRLLELDLTSDGEPDSSASPPTAESDGDQTGSICRVSGGGSGSSPPGRRQCSGSDSGRP